MADEQQGVRVLGRKDDEQQLYGSVQLKAQDLTAFCFKGPWQMQSIFHHFPENWLYLTAKISQVTESTNRN